MTHKYELMLSSPPDRERLVCEIFIDDVQWAEINCEEDEAIVEFYPKPDGTDWAIPLKVALDLLTRGSQRLLDRIQ